MRCFWELKIYILTGLDLKNQLLGECALFTESSRFSYPSFYAYTRKSFVSLELHPLSLVKMFSLSFLVQQCKQHQVTGECALLIAGLAAGLCWFRVICVRILLDLDYLYWGPHVKYFSYERLWKNPPNMTSLNTNWSWKRQETKLNTIWKQINIKNNTITPSAVRVHCVEKSKVKSWCYYLFLPNFT